MTAPADLILVNGRIHTFADSTETETETGATESSPDAEAVAVRDGRIIRVGLDSEVRFVAGVETTRIDLGGQTLLPGFIDAHTHLEMVGRQAREADLSDATSPSDCLDRLAARAEETDGWVLGFAYDESNWDESRYLTRTELDSISTDRPVAAFREDMHLVSVNSVVLDTYSFPSQYLRTEGGEPTGVLVEEAVEVLWEELQPSVARTREYLEAAQAIAVSRGVTAIHDMVRHSHAPRIYRELDQSDDLAIRVRLNYWADHLDAVLETGLRTNHGSEFVTTGAIKTYADGSIGGQTAKLSTAYADGEGRGEWVTDPETLRTLVGRVDDSGLQMATHAIGDEAIQAVVETYERTEGERHRIEHAEVLTEGLIDRLANSEMVVSAQPNFHKWAGSDGLYARRLGESRRVKTNQFRELVDAGAVLAFGSDCMPLDPLLGVHHAVNAPEPAQRLSVGEAIQAYTHGGAFAGFDEHRMGTIAPGMCADVVALSESPWESDSISDIDVMLTVVDGEVVYENRD